MRSKSEIALVKAMIGTDLEDRIFEEIRPWHRRDLTRVMIEVFLLKETFKHTYNRYTAEVERLFGKEADFLIDLAARVEEAYLYEDFVCGYPEKPVME